MDLVYTVRNGNNNQRLQYSLRSIALFAPKFDKIWIVGYKPSWVVNVEYITTQQDKGAVQNVGNNILAACKHKGVSENFMLMSDDYICATPHKEWDCRVLIKGRLSDQLLSYRRKGQEIYEDAVKNTIEILQGIFLTQQEFDNYDLHMPIMINKAAYIQAITLPVVQSYQYSNLMWRSLYGNLTHTNPTTISDVKLYDDCAPRSTWASLTHEYNKMPRLNNWLNKTLKDKCIYEAK